MNKKNSKEKFNFSDFPLEVPNYRFDQRNELFKRRTWDPEIKPFGDRLYSEVRYQDRKGYRKIDYAFRNASWNMEYDFAFGNMCSNTGMYSWSRIADKSKRFVETGGQVENSPQKNSHIVKKAARFFGADLVGICKVHPNLIYSHELNLLKNEHNEINLPENHDNVIVMAVEMDYETCKYSPDAISGASTGFGYSQQAVLANFLAAFIRGLGYQAAPSGNDTGPTIPFAIGAGLGELGRNGLLITEKYGPRIRICKVFTDLPLVYDRPKNFGVEEFCLICKKCAHNCPSKAITFEKKTYEGPTMSNHSGVKKWYINADQCFIYWSKNMMDCNNCVRSCPFNKPKRMLQNTVRYRIKRLPVFNRVMLWMDDISGYGRSITNDFWAET